MQDARSHKTRWRRFSLSPLWNMPWRTPPIFRTAPGVGLRTARLQQREARVTMNRGLTQSPLRRGVQNSGPDGVDTRRDLPDCWASTTAGAPSREPHPLPLYPSVERRAGVARCHFVTRKDVFQRHRQTKAAETSPDASARVTAPLSRAPARSTPGPTGMAGPPPAPLAVPVNWTGWMSRRVRPYGPHRRQLGIGGQGLSRPAASVGAAAHHRSTVGSWVRLSWGARRPLHCR